MINFTDCVNKHKFFCAHGFAFEILLRSKWKQCPNVLPDVTTLNEYASLPISLNDMQNNKEQLSAGTR